MRATVTAFQPAFLSFLWIMREKRRETAGHRTRGVSGLSRCLLKRRQPAFSVRVPDLRFGGCFWNDVLVGTDGAPEVILGSFSQR